MVDSLNIDDELKKIAADNSSGSTDLLIKLIDYFSDAPEKLKDERLLNFLSEHFSPFQSIKDFLSRSKSLSSEDTSLIGDFLKNEKEYLFSEIKLLFEKSSHLFNKTESIVTISNSFFLRNFLILLHQKNEKMIVSVSESRPQFEGRILAEALAQNGIEINLFTEAQTPAVVERSDCVIIGADKILPDGSAVNKTGSRNLAVNAKYFKKPFFVLGSKKKISDSDEYDEGLHKQDEIYTNSDNSLIRITNNYFERIEPSLVTAILHI